MDQASSITTRTTRANDLFMIGADMICWPVVIEEKMQQSWQVWNSHSKINEIIFLPAKTQSTKANVNHVRAALNLVVALLQNIKGRRRGIDSNCRRWTSSLWFGVSKVNGCVILKSNQCNCMEFMGCVNWRYVQKIKEKKKGKKKAST